MSTIKITTKNPVSGLGPFNDVTANVHHEIQTFTEVYNSGENDPQFIANGRYYYLEANGNIVVLKAWARPFSAAEANGLFEALNIQFPDGASFSQKRQIEKLAALKYQTASEGKYGLTINDWE